ncbi:MAG TPA: alpha/beta fold hydrolase [Candidatus Latescibacteria bacterium]|nr:alpha/beta fold hydrolase [Candidatus Latescibacterota bacterium]HOS64056.1 alpha/beta fold hydrolase [Candidatus Latescibacterota bacterium]HPK74911.1 alpha/beta fold hydrolase [Candidatus Latescibacterota bacterium]
MVRKIILCAAVVATAFFVGCGGEEKECTPVTVEAQTVEIITEDSVTLVGTWFGVPNSRASIVCLPALTHSRGTWASTAQQFVASGWSVLTVDLRDQGDSQMPAGASPVWVGNDTLHALAYYIKDVKAAVAFVRSKAPGAKVVVLGAGIAGYCGLHEAVADPTVAAVALFSPPESSRLTTPAIMAEYGDRPLLIMTELPAEAIRTTPRTLDSWIGRGSVIEIKEQVPRPPLRLENKAAAVDFLNRWIKAAVR